MLDDELHRDRKSEQRGDRNRHARERQRRRADSHIKHLMQRVADKAVEAVKARHAVMNGVETPEGGPAVAQEMNEREREVSDDERQYELGAEWATRAATGR